MEVYDFSMQGRSKYLSEQVDADLGGVRYLAPIGANAQLPWDIHELVDMNGGHDSVVFFRVSVLLFFSATRLNDALHVAAQMPNDSREDGFEMDGGVLHIWAF